MDDSTLISNYISHLFPQFESSLKEKLIANARIKTFAAGEVMMQTGQYFRSTMLIAEGRVKLYRQGDDGNEFFMYYIEPGQACALSMICAAKQQTSEVTAKAVDDTVGLLVPIELMDELMKDHKSWYYFVIETYRNRYEELLNMVDQIAFRAMDERLEFYLINQVQVLQVNQLPLTHQQIATDLNSSREVISRLLKKMEQKGMLSLQRNYIHWLQ